MVMGLPLFSCRDGICGRLCSRKTSSGIVLTNVSLGTPGVLCILFKVIYVVHFILLLFMGESISELSLMNFPDILGFTS
jgi:hypothetical protein